MKILIVDDDKYSSIYLLKILSEYGKCDIASNGIEAVDAFFWLTRKAFPMT